MGSRSRDAVWNWGKQQEQMGASPGGGELASLGAVQFALVETFTSSGTAGDFLALGQPVGNFGSVENLAASPGVESLGNLGCGEFNQFGVNPECGEFRQLASSGEFS